MRLHLRGTKLSNSVTSASQRWRTIVAKSHINRFVVFASAAVLLSGAVAVADSTLQNQTTTYNGCVNNGSGILRVIQPGESCRSNETAISWNQTGPAGPAGSAGPAGQQGIQGEKGDTGPAGTVSLASLAGTACTRVDGSAGVVGISVGGVLTPGSGDVINLRCLAQGAWCSANTPDFTPHMTVTCNEQTHQLTYVCEDGWQNTNNEMNDGCEASTGGLQPLLINKDMTTYEALAHLTASGLLFGGIDTITVPANCSGTYQAACPDGTASNPLPTMTADMNKRAADFDRTVVVPDPDNSRYNITARFRLKTNTPITVTPVAGTHCALTIDSTRGNSPDIIASFHDNILAPNGPTTVSDVTLSGLESADFSINPVNASDFLCYGASIFPSANVLSVLENELTPWLTKRATLCGAVAPYYFQICSAD
jgi:hypothetical protein